MDDISISGKDDDHYLGVGALLSHKISDGTECSTGYVSRSLNSAEHGYSTVEKEALAIFFGGKRFHQFLYGLKFTIQTDHKPLEGLFGKRKGILQQVGPDISRV